MITAIRLYKPDESRVEGEGSPAQKLSEFFEACYLPLVSAPRGQHQKTVVALRESVAHWKKITGDPRLDAISDFVAADFVEGLAKLPGRKGRSLSVATIRKHCVAIQAILDFAGPKTRDRWGRKNRGLIDPPFLERPTADQEAPNGDFSLEDLQAILGATRSATLPRILGVWPAEWWSAIVIVGAHTGLRIGELMRAEWRDLTGNYLTIPAKNAKRRRGKKQYLSAEALAAIDAIRTERRIIFEWPNWEKNSRWLLEHFKRLQAAGGIPLERRRGFHGLRRFHATAIAAAGAGGQGMLAAAISLGHSSPRTTAKHYVSGTVQSRLAESAIDGLPSLKTRADSQRRLFE